MPRASQEGHAITWICTYLCPKGFRSVINWTYKSNFWLQIYYFTYLIKMYLFLCYYYHCWLVNWNYIKNYFNSESCWFYVEIKKIFFSVQFTSFLLKYVQGMFSYRAPNRRKPSTYKLFSFKTAFFKKKEWRNLLHYQ